jgi:murein DD-endopeptidase MepM/ murein hydrolase activator NlpD
VSQQPSRVRVVGTDRARVSPIEAQAIQPPQDVSRNFMQAAGQASQAGYQHLLQNVDGLSKLTQQVTQDAINSNTAVSQAAVNAAQYAGQRQQQTSTALGQVANTLQSMADTQLKKQMFEEQQREQRQKELRETLRAELEARVKKAAEEQKRIQQENATQAFIEMQDFVVAAPDIIKEKGATYARQQMLAIASRRDMTPEDVTRILGFGYNALGSTIGEQRKISQDKVDQAKALYTEQKVAEFQLKTQATISDIKYATGDITPFMTKLKEQFGEFVKANPDLDFLQVLTLQKSMLEDAREATKHSFDKQEMIAKEIDGISSFINEIAPYIEKLRSNAITPQEFEAKKLQIAAKYGLPTGTADALANPLAAEESALRNQEVQSKLQELQRSGYLAGVNGLQLNDAFIAQQAWTFINNPAAFEAAKQNPEYKDRNDFRQIFAVVERYNLYNKEKNDTQNRVLELRKQLDAWNASTIKQSAAGKPATDGFELFEQTVPGIILAQRELSPEQQEAWNQIRTDGANAIIHQINLLENKHKEFYREMMRYGLHEGEKSITEFLVKNAAQIEQVNKMYEALNSGNSTPQLAGAAPNFKPGSPSQGSTQFKRAVYKGQNMIFPFRPNTQMTVTSGYGMRKHPITGEMKNHSGIDIDVAAGTPVIATGSGTVIHTSNDPKGYGLYTDVKFDDGSIQRFAHLQGFFVREGQRVYQGQPIGRVGNTGGSTGTHLHWEFRKAVEGGHENTIDPVMAASQLVSTIGTVRPLSDTRSWNNNYSPFFGSKPENQPPVIPKGALPLFGGLYILDNKIFEANGGTDVNGQPQPKADAGSAYNRANALKQTFTPNHKVGFDPVKENKPNNNYGYAVLARDKEFAKKLSQVATRLGVPAMWIADIMAFETGGSFDPKKPNGIGYYGLIQFGEAAAKDLGTTLPQLTAMTRVQQLDYVEKYFRMMGDRHGKGLNSYPSIEYLLAAVWGGQRLMKRLDDAPNEALEWSDGWIKFKDYLKRLGNHAGRQYAVAGSGRKNQVANVIHTKYVDGCPVCNQLVASNSNIIPHEGQA